jgi:sporulation integral membrane protein YtvI
MKELPISLIKTAIIILIVLAVFISVFLSYYYVVPAITGTLRFIIPPLLPFILAYIIAELIDPLVNFLENRFKLNRGFTIFAVLFLLFGGLTAGIVWIVVRLSIELIKLSKYLPQLSNDLTRHLLELFNQLTDLYFSLGLNYDVSEQIISNVTRSIEKVINHFTTLVGQLFTGSFYLLSQVPQVLLIIIFTLMATFLISRDKKKIIKKIKDLLPVRAGQVLESTMQEVGGALIGFLQAQFVLMLVTFFLTLIGLSFLGIEFALSIALLAGLFDILPVLGPGAIFITWAIWEVINYNFRLAIGLAILYILLTIVHQLLQPKIVSSNVGIHPLEALLGIYIGLKVFGVLGVFIGPILLIIIKAFRRGWKKHIKE